MRGAFRAPVLVTEPAFAGSLAAVRVLGRSGIPVTVGGRGLLQAARWSRLTAEYCTVNTDRGQDEFLADVKILARKSRRHVLLPTSDVTAWLYSNCKETLEDDFIVYVPSASVIETIIDKEKLWRVCQVVGIPTIDTWFPQEFDQISMLEPELRYPLVIKPRSHVHSEFFTKGLVVRTSNELAAEFTKFMERLSAKSNESTCPRPAAPIIQFFVEEAVENVVSVSGFIDQSGKRSVVRACRKTLQRSRPIGLGLVFEAIEVDPILATAAIGLCRELNYFGIFEIEFIQLAGAWRLIDFNPRFYQEMALDIAAGAPLPLLAYLDACNERQLMEKLITDSFKSPYKDFCFADTFSLLLRSLVNPIMNWKALCWLVKKRGHLIDATFDKKDPLPSLVHFMSEIMGALGRFAANAAKGRRPSALRATTDGRHPAH